MNQNNDENQNQEMVQGSDAWKRWRSKGIGSSDIPVIMGVSPWKDIQTLWAEKTGRIEDSVKDNFFMAQGRSMEGVARDIYEFDFQVSMEPATFELVRYPFCRGSYDGFNVDLGYGIEIKTPKQSEVLLAKEGKIAEKYWPQLQWLMMISNSPKIHYICCDADSPFGQITVVEFMADKKYQRRMLWHARRFWHYVVTDQELPLKWNPYVCKESFQTIVKVPKVRSKKRTVRKTKGKEAIPDN